MSGTIDSRETNTEYSEVHAAIKHFRDDPRVQEAKRLLLEVLKEHASQVDGVRDPSPELVDTYEQMLQRLSVARGGATYFPYLTSGVGNGPFVQLADGSVKLDFIGGIGVHGMGHSHPKILEAVIDSAFEDTVMQGNLQQNPATIAFSEKLIGLARQQGADLAHCLLTTSGAMANENALKIAFHHRTPADRVICIEKCFAGRTMVLTQMTDRPQYRVGLPRTVQVDYLPMYKAEEPAKSIETAVASLKTMLTRYPGQYAALWMELVAGEGGYYAGSPAYFRALIELCRENNILVIFDEVQSFTRLSQPFAFQHYGLDAFADIVTIGKITQVCATLYREDLKPKCPLLSQTFTSSSASLLAGLATLEELETKGCFGPKGWNMRRHEYFAGRLGNLAQKYPGKISGPFGEGMMVAFTPGDGTDAAAKAMVFSLYEAGLMSFVAGSHPTRIRFLPPPAIATEEHIDLACSIIESVLNTTE